MPKSLLQPSCNAQILIIMHKLSAIFSFPRSCHWRVLCPMSILWGIGFGLFVWSFSNREKGFIQDTFKRALFGTGLIQDRALFKGNGLHWSLCLCTIIYLQVKTHLYSLDEEAGKKGMLRCSQPPPPNKVSGIRPYIFVLICCNYVFMYNKLLQN